jgi:formate hydrogenlyase subunit 6/NADH:ubiquinone oxidoreductase subunit I
MDYVVTGSPYTITTKCIGCSVCKKICPVNAITGEREKLHYISSRLCIECGACGRICPQEAVRDAFHRYVKRIRRQKTWYKPQVDNDKCVSCNICIDTCPTDCLELTYNEDTEDRTVLPVLRNAKACIACGFCQLECPVGAIMMKPPETLA